MPIDITSEMKETYSNVSVNTLRTAEERQQVDHGEDG